MRKTTITTIVTTVTVIEGRQKAPYSFVRDIGYHTSWINEKVREWRTAYEYGPCSYTDLLNRAADLYVETALAEEHIRNRKVFIGTREMPGRTRRNSLDVFSLLHLLVRQDVQEILGGYRDRDIPASVFLGALEPVVRRINTLVLEASDYSLPRRQREYLEYAARAVAALQSDIAAGIRRGLGERTEEE